MIATSPTLMKWLLARELERMRTQAGLTTDDVALALGCNRSRVSHLETRRKVPTRPDLDVMTRLYGQPDRLEDLDALRVGANERGWWAVHKLPAWLQAYIGLEDAARKIERFTLELVPGTLQTPEYAKVMFRMYRTPEVEIDRHLAARMGRQARLGTGDLELSVVMSEALLQRTAWMGEVGLGQLQRLHHDAMRTGGVQIQVLPFAVGAHPSMWAAFTLLRFPSGTLDTVGYQEHTTGGSLTDDPSAVATLEGSYADLVTMALPAKASAALLSQYIEKTKEIINDQQ